MSTLSVPLTPDLTRTMEHLLESGAGSNKADIARKAIEFFAEAQAVQAVIHAQQETSLSGDLDALALQL